MGNNWRKLVSFVENHAVIYPLIEAIEPVILKRDKPYKIVETLKPSSSHPLSAYLGSDRLSCSVSKFYNFVRNF